MKICKNCGQQTDDGKIRCPHCGFLFEEDMDDVLREMKANLKNYRSEVVAAQPQQSVPLQNAAPQYAPSQAAAQGAAPQYASAQGASAAEWQSEQGEPSSAREKFELLSEVAQLKGEVRVLQGEIERMNAGKGAPMQVVYAQPANGAQGVYTQRPSVQQDTPSPYLSGKPVVKKRSVNRIVISVFCTLLLGVSIGMFFLAWIDQWLDDFGGTVKGFQGILYIFDKESADTLGFQGMLWQIDNHVYASGATITNICRKVCHFIAQWGVVAYAVALVLSVPILFSLGGKIKFRAWHRFWAWISFIFALILFGVFCWSFGFNAVTVWFLLGAGANFVRAIFLCFFRKDKFSEGGLQ